MDLFSSIVHMPTRNQAKKSPPVGLRKLGETLIVIFTPGAAAADAQEILSNHPRCPYRCCQHISRIKKRDGRLTISSET
jgi:hypothetical protein